MKVCSNDSKASPTICREFINCIGKCEEIASRFRHLRKKGRIKNNLIIEKIRLDNESHSKGA